MVFTHLSIQALDFLSDRSKQVAIVGDLDRDETKKMLRALQLEYNPNTVIAVGLPESDEYSRIALLKDKELVSGRHGGVYICENRVCKFPTLDIVEARSLLSSMSSLKLVG